MKKKSLYDLNQPNTGKGGSMLRWLGSVVVSGAIVVMISLAAYSVWPVGSKLWAVPAAPGSAAVASTSMPVTPWPTAIVDPNGKNISQEVEGLQLTVIDIEPLPNGKLRFWLMAQNQAADAKTLPVENFLVIDEKTKIQYRADRRESRWIETVAAKLPGSIGQITLERPLAASVTQISIGFSGMRDVPDIFIHNVPVTVRAPSGVDVELHSPYIDGLQLGVTRVENSDGNLRVWVEAKHIEIGPLPFMPSPVEFQDAAKRAEQAKETERNMREWRFLQNSELTFQDNTGRIYDVDAARSEWDREVMPGGNFKGYVTISQTLESSVTKLKLIYRDQQHPEAILISGIPVPQSDGSHATLPAADLSFAPCVVMSRVPVFAGQLSEGDKDRLFTPEQNKLLKRTPQVPIPTVITQTLNVESETQCGVTLGVKTVSQSVDKIVTRIAITVMNQSGWPQRTLGNGLEVSDAKGRSYQYFNWFCYNFVLCPPWMAAKTGWTAWLDIKGLSPDVTELRLSLRLQGGQVLVIDHIRLPDSAQGGTPSPTTPATAGVTIDSTPMATPSPTTPAIAAITPTRGPSPDVVGITLTSCTVTTKFGAALTSKPSMDDSVVLANLPSDQHYQATKRSDEFPTWFYVTNNGQGGWVSSLFLTVSQGCTG